VLNSPGIWRIFRQSTILRALAWGQGGEQKKWTLGFEVFASILRAQGSDFVKKAWRDLNGHKGTKAVTSALFLDASCLPKTFPPFDGEVSMSELKGSKTESNLKAAFSSEAEANRRYLYFASKADIEGQVQIAALFRATAEGETGHAHGHLEWLEQCGDPSTGLPIGPTKDNLKAAVAGETHEYTDMYPGMAKTARDEGFDEIADWFEILAKAERSHANRYAKALSEYVD